MWNVQKAVVTSLIVLAAGTVWPTRTTAQEKPGVVTVFDHKILDASFAKAVSNGGTSLLWSHASSDGTYKVDTHSRESMKAACKPEGCSHTGYTAVVYVVSGAATLGHRRHGQSCGRRTSSAANQSRVASHIVSAKEMCTSSLPTRSIGIRTWKRRSTILRCPSNKITVSYLKNKPLTTALAPAARVTLILTCPEMVQRR